MIALQDPQIASYNIKENRNYMEAPINLEEHMMRLYFFFSDYIEGTFIELDPQIGRITLAKERLELVEGQGWVQKPVDIQMKAYDPDDDDYERSLFFSNQKRNTIHTAADPSELEL